MGSFWKEAWEGSGSGEFWFPVLFGQRDLGGSVSLELRSEGCRETNQSRKRRWGERICFWRSTCVLLGASGICTFIRIQKRN